MIGSGRSWGPFSGGQLTMMVCVIVVAIAFPVGAWAVSGTSVFVTDNVSGKTATVNASGQLSVNAGGFGHGETHPAVVELQHELRVRRLGQHVRLPHAQGPGRQGPHRALGDDLRRRGGAGPLDLGRSGTGKAGLALRAAGPVVDISALSGEGASENIPFPQGLPISRDTARRAHRQPCSLREPRVRVRRSEGILVSSSLRACVRTADRCY